MKCVIIWLKVTISCFTLAYQLIHVYSLAHFFIPLVLILMFDFQVRELLLFRFSFLSRNKIEFHFHLEYLSNIPEIKCSFDSPFKQSQTNQKAKPTSSLKSSLVLKVYLYHH